MPSQAFPRTASGRSLSRLGLGCSRIGSFNNPVPMHSIRQLLAQSLDLGVNVFDTADIYGQGDSEREIGRALAGRRSEAFVVTKVGKAFSAKMRILRPLKPLIKPLLAATGRGADVVTPRRGSSLDMDFEPGHLRRALESSLRRLGADSVDGLMLHSPPAAVVRDPAISHLLAGFRKAGKVRHYGVSCDDLEAVKAASAMEGLSLLQVPLDVLEAAAGSGVGARMFDRGIAVFAREVIRLSPGQAPADAVARACRRPEVTTAIVGTSRLEHLREMVDATAGAGRL